MRMGLAIVGLVLIALGWENAILADRHPALSFVGLALVVASRRWPGRDLGIAAAVAFLPFAYWLYGASGFQQPMICSEESGCHESWGLPNGVETALELVPLLVIAALAWRLRKHDPLASGPVVPARESGL